MSILKRKDRYGHSLYVIEKDKLKEIANMTKTTSMLFKKMVLVQSRVLSLSMKKDNYVPIITVGNKLFFGKIENMKKDTALVHWKRKDKCDLPMKYKISN